MNDQNCVASTPTNTRPEPLTAQAVLAQLEQIAPTPRPGQCVMCSRPGDPGAGFHYCGSCWWRNFG